MYLVIKKRGEITVESCFSLLIHFTEQVDIRMRESSLGFSVAAVLQVAANSVRECFLRIVNRKSFGNCTARHVVSQICLYRATAVVLPLGWLSQA